MPGLTQELANIDLYISSKQDGLLGIEDVPGLETALNGKQAVISSSSRLNANLISGGHVSNTEFGYLNGVTSPLQPQLDDKQPLIAPGARLNANLISGGGVSNTEFGYLNGVTSHLQPQLNGLVSDIDAISSQLSSFSTQVVNLSSSKQDLISSGSRLNANLIADGTVSDAEFGYLNGVSSSIQTQLDGVNTSLSGKQLQLDTPQIATPSGDGSLSLGAGVGFNTRLTYTPPDRTLTGIDIQPNAVNCSTISASRGLNTTSYFGKAKIGYMGYNNYAGFGHEALQSPDTYAVLQQWNGTTFINCTTDRAIKFRENNLHEFAQFSSHLGGSMAFRCNQFAFYSTPGVTVLDADARIMFVQFNGIAYWWARNSKNEGGLINAWYFGDSLPSDDRLKHDETPLADGIEIVKLLQPYRYTQMKSLDDDPADNTSGYEQIGFIADDVEKIPALTCLVREVLDTHFHDNNKTVKSLNYNGIIGVSVQALKELIAKVEVLEARVAALET